MKLIDRTLPEILDIRPEVSEKKLIQFVNSLHKLGVDYLEIDKRVIGCFNNFPQEMNYIFRVDSYEDLVSVEECKFTNVIIDTKDNCSDSKSYIIKFLTQNIANYREIKIILEISVESFDELDRYLSSKNNIISKVSCLRITGLESTFTLNIGEQIQRLREKYDIEIDICAKDTNFCATAVAIEALRDGVDFVTSTFSGVGGEFGYSALEEVIMTAKVIYSMDLKGDTTILQQMKLQFEELTATVIAKDKPILGSQIFVCESGVHIDGIIKNPKNYEPFEPELVGLKRQIVLGKHSGANALESILKLNNITYNISDLPKLLKKIQEKSVESKSFFDGEALRKLVAEHSFC